MNLQPRLYPGLDQNQALNSEASSLLIRALAGTGKTTTLAIKATDLIRTQGARNVLMLAYSEAGIKAIQARLDRLSAVHLEGLHLLTLEQFCARLLEEQGDPVPMLSSGLEKNLLIQQAHEALSQEAERHAELDIPELADYFARPLDISAFLLRGPGQAVHAGTRHRRQRPRRAGILPRQRSGLRPVPAAAQL
jgi:superfamily I DNA/RNA helicase